MTIKKIQLSLLLLVLISVFAGCEKYIEFDAEVKTPKIVVNGLFRPDSVWQLHVSNSLSVIDDGQLKPIENATVSISDANGNLVEQLVHDEFGYYRGTTFPVVGESYTVNASAPNYTSVSSSDKLPAAVAITSIDTVRNVDLDGFESMKITVGFTDPIGENHYSLRIREVNADGQGQVYYNYIYCYSSDPTFENIGTDEGSTFGLFRDVVFDGQSHSVSFQIDSYYFDQGGLTGMEVVLQSATEAGYNYRLSFERYQNSDGNPFAQPVQVFSNVENGFGLFSGYSESVFPL